MRLIYKKLLVAAAITIVMAGAGAVFFSSRPLADEITGAVSVQIVTPHGVSHPFMLEVANTPELRRRGLMGRRTLDPDRGMLFVWPDNALRLFWMKDTPLPLDILFFDAGGYLVHQHRQAQPLSEESISSLVPVKYVVELLGGEAQRRQMGLSSQLLFNTQPAPPR